MLKKMMLLMLFVLFIGSLFAVSDSIKIAEKNKKYVKVIKTNPPFPLCKKVFPGVEFYVKLYLPTTPPGKTYYGKYNDKYYLLNDEYSSLFKQVKDKSNATLYDNLLLLLQFSFIVNRSTVDSLILTDLKPLTKKGKNKLKRDKLALNLGYNYQAKIKLYKYNYRFVNDLVAYIKVKDNIIEYIEFHDIIRKISAGSINPLSLNNLRTPDVAIIGGNSSHENVESKDYYYIEVNNNSVTTDSSITFQILNLEPNEENVKLKLKPEYGYGDDYYFLEQLLLVDSSGIAEYTWIPSNNNDTGFSNVIIKRGAIETTIENLIIVPEHIISGIFESDFTSNYHYKIHYCNQFFSMHPEGITYANTFATYAGSALVESWDRQVDDWNLAEGCNNSTPNDIDKIYELFVNDNLDNPANYKYHNTYTNQASPSPIDRWIGIRYNSYIIQNLYSSEEMRIKVAVAHEFYHGIEFSLNSGYHGAIMDWMQEGQARFIPSVQYPSEEFMGEITQHFYPKDANEYLKNWLNKSLVINYGTPEYSDYMSFKYCLFWRFLYENYSESTIVKDKMEIIRETCRGNTSADLPTIKTSMDTKLGANGGKYHSFDEALMAFGKNIYFNDPSDDNWHPDPSNEFYASITPTETQHLGTDGAMINLSHADLKSFGMNYTKVTLDDGVNSVGILFDKIDADSPEEFGLNVWMLKDNVLKSSRSFHLNAAIPNIADELATNNIDEIILNVIRLDPFESSSKDGGYNITLNKLDFANLMDPSMFSDNVVNVKSRSSEANGHASYLLDDGGSNSEFDTLYDGEFEKCEPLENISTLNFEASGPPQSHYTISLNNGYFSNEYFNSASNATVTGYNEHDGIFFEANVSNYHVNESEGNVSISFSSTPPDVSYTDENGNLILPDQSYTISLNFNSRSVVTMLQFDTVEIVDGLPMDSPALMLPGYARCIDRYFYPGNSPEGEGYKILDSYIEESFDYSIWKLIINGNISLATSSCIIDKNEHDIYNEGFPFSGKYISSSKIEFSDSHFIDPNFDCEDFYVRIMPSTHKRRNWNNSYYSNRPYSSVGGWNYDYNAGLYKIQSYNSTEKEITLDESIEHFIAKTYEDIGDSTCFFYLFKKAKDNDIVSFVEDTDDNTDITYPMGYILTGAVSHKPNSYIGAPKIYLESDDEYYRWDGEDWIVNGKFSVPSRINKSINANLFPIPVDYYNEKIPLSEISRSDTIFIWNQELKFQPPMNPVLEDPEDTNNIDVKNIYASFSENSLDMSIDFYTFPEGDTTQDAIQGIICLDTDQKIGSNNFSEFFPDLPIGPDYVVMLDFKGNYYALFNDPESEPIFAGSLEQDEDNLKKYSLNIPRSFQGLPILDIEGIGINFTGFIGDQFGSLDYFPNQSDEYGTIRFMPNWLNIQPYNGYEYLAPGVTKNLDCYFNTGELKTGNYKAKLSFATNDLRNPDRVLEINLRYIGKRQDSFFPKPENLSVSLLNKSNILLTWDKPYVLEDLSSSSNGKLSFKIEDKQEPIGYQIFRNNEMVFQIKDSNIRKFLDDKIEKGNYQYKVKAIYMEGESDFTLPVSVNLNYFVVDKNGKGDFREIQEAINSPKVLSGSTIIINSGIYNSFVLNKSLELIGSKEETKSDKSEIIVKNSTNSEKPKDNVISILSSNINVIIDGLTVSNGKENNIFIDSPHSSITIRNSIIQNSTGNAIKITNSGLNISNSTSNRKLSNEKMRNKFISIEYCQINNNLGYAIVSKNDYVNIDHCTIAYNNKDVNIAIGKIINSIFYNNQNSISKLNIPIGYSCIENRNWSGKGNIFSNPIFSTEKSNTKLSLNCFSPCIDKGDPKYKLDYDNTRTDMGAIPYYQPNYVNKPTNLTITRNESNKITLNWTEGDGAIFYDIYGSENPYSITDILATKVRATSWQDTLSGNRKFYIVKGKNNRTSHKKFVIKNSYYNVSK